jgi:hypothetical protein
MIATPRGRCYTCSTAKPGCDLLMNTNILAPAAALVLWSLVILGWLAATRLPAMKKAGVDLSTVVGARGESLEGVIPDKVNWKAHNYSHLMEQPTIFYATVFILALSQTGTPLNVGLAWGYVILRILHSLVQVTFNRVALRFALFALSTLCLLVLSVNAIWATI